MNSHFCYRYTPEYDHVTTFTFVQVWDCFHNTCAHFVLRCFLVFCQVDTFNNNYVTDFHMTVMFWQQWRFSFFGIFCFFKVLICQLLFCQLLFCQLLFFQLLFSQTMCFVNYVLSTIILSNHEDPDRRVRYFLRIAHVGMRRGGGWGIRRALEGLVIVSPGVWASRLPSSRNIPHYSRAPSTAHCTRIKNTI